MKKRIKLLHIISSLEVGGAQAVLCDLIEHLDSEQFEHKVIYFHAGPHSARLQALGVQMYQVDGALFRYDPVFFIRLFKLVRRLKPDCIHSLLWAANVSSRVVGRMLGIRVISALHNNVDQDGLIRAAFDRLTLALTDQFVAVSKGVAQSLTKRDRWVPAHKISVIPNGVNVAEVRERGLQYQQSRYALGLTDEHVVIGSVGRFVAVKNYRLLIKAFALVNYEHPMTRLVLVGSGPQESALRELVHELKLDDSVTFIGRQQAYGYYSLFDCFALSSAKEGVSIALLEAMSFGLPCVVTNSEHTHSVLTHEHNGLVVPAHDVRALATTLGLIVTEVQLRTNLGSNAQRTVDEFFALKPMVKAYKMLFTNKGIGSKKI